MGTIASVLQWTCSKCNLINPTERLECLKCGNIRCILEEYGDNKSINSITTCSNGSDVNIINDDSQQINQCGNRESQKHPLQLPAGYVEISSNG